MKTMYLAAFTSFTTHGSFASTIVGDARLELHGGASFGTVDGRGAWWPGPTGSRATTTRATT